MAGGVKDLTVMVPMMDVMVVRRNSPAWEAMVRICRNGLKPGEVHQVSDEEFESLKEDAMRMSIDPLTPS